MGNAEVGMGKAECGSRNEVKRSWEAESSKQKRLEAKKMSGTGVSGVRCQDSTPGSPVLIRHRRKAFCKSEQKWDQNLNPYESILE